VKSDRDDGRLPTADRWEKLPGGSGKFQNWSLLGTEYQVRHCGHPTANYPWYGLTPDGEIITSGLRGELGYAFRYLADAKIATELVSSGRRDQVPLFAQHRGLKKKRR
jgi:hypothetical protein